MNERKTYGTLMSSNMMRGVPLGKPVSCVTAGISDAHVAALGTNSEPWYWSVPVSGSYSFTNIKMSSAISNGSAHNCTWVD